MSTDDRPSPAEVVMVRAAGGVLWRSAPGPEEMQVVVVHRPRYDDWSLPKGKLLEGETFEEGALREMEEETGFTASLGRSLGEVRYLDHRGRPKVVRWWAMEAVEGEFAPNDEVDVLRWVSPHAASAILSYDTDREILRRFRATVGR